jgi:hypothetical protein
VLAASAFAGELAATGEDGAAGGAEPGPDAGTAAQPVEHDVGHLGHRVGEEDEAEIGAVGGRIELVEHRLQELRPGPPGGEDEPAHQAWDAGGRAVTE